MTWEIRYFSREVERDLDNLPPDLRSRFVRIARMIQDVGIARMREPYVKHLEGPVWEMRMIGPSGDARAAYVTATGRRIVVLCVFRKKTQRTPRRFIELALQRAKEVQ